MTAPFVGALQRLTTGIAQWFVTQRWGGAFLQAVGLTLDGAVDSTYRMVRAGRPDMCDSDALPAISRERMIRLYPTEPEVSQRTRLRRWRKLHRRRGSQRGELEHLQPYFLPGALPILRMVHQAGDGSSATWHTLYPDGTYEVHRATPSNWDWDGQAGEWSRVWLVIEVAGSSIDGGQTNWDDPSWDDGHLWGGLPTDAQIVDIVAIVNEWKAAHEALWGVLLVMPGGSLDPAGSAATLPDGSTTFPQGNWWTYTNPTTGQPTRPTYIRTIYTRGHG